MASLSDTEGGKLQEQGPWAFRAPAPFRIRMQKAAALLYVIFQWIFENPFTTA